MPEWHKPSSQICSSWKLWCQDFFQFEDTAPHPEIEEETCEKRKGKIIVLQFIVYQNHQMSEVLKKLFSLVHRFQKKKLKFELDPGQRIVFFWFMLVPLSYIPGSISLFPYHLDCLMTNSNNNHTSKMKITLKTRKHFGKRYSKINENANKLPS
jgi:hypothetical protein